MALPGRLLKQQTLAHGELVHVVHMPRSVRRNRCARVYGRSQSFFSYATLRTRSATCCAKLFSAFSNHPHPRPPEVCPRLLGDGGGSPFLSVGSDLAWRAHAAHGVWSSDCALS